MPNIYGLTPEQTRLVNTAAEIAQSTLSKHAADVDDKSRFPVEGIRALADAGLHGLCVPRDLGGHGAPPRAFAGVVEALGAKCPSTAMIYVMHITAGQAIASSTTLVDRKDILKAMAAGKHLTTLAFSEKGSRSNFWAPVSRMDARGDGFVTTGAKSWVTAANHADSYVSSSQAPGAKSPMESVIYLARKGSKGLGVVGQFSGIGLRGNDSAPVSVEDLALTKGDLISELGAGAKTMLEVVLPWFAVGTSAMANGICGEVTALTAKHLSTTVEHTASQLRDYPTVRARLAQMSCKTEASRALLGYLVGDLEQPSASTPLTVLQARAVAMDAAVEVTDLGMKACGGAAFSRHLPVDRLFRDARAGWVMAPTVDHLQDFIGKALSGLPLF